MGYRIKLVDGKDADIAEKILRMHREIFGESAPQVPTWEGSWWIAYKEKTPVGFAGLKITAAGDGYLQRAGVLPAHRGHGLQRKMIKIREAHARKAGISRLISDTTDSIVSSNNLIECGFRLFTPQELWAWDHTLYWQKVL